MPSQFSDLVPSRYGDDTPAKSELQNPGPGKNTSSNDLKNFMPSGFGSYERSKIPEKQSNADGGLSNFMPSGFGGMERSKIPEKQSKADIGGLSNFMPSGFGGIERSVIPEKKQSEVGGISQFQPSGVGNIEASLIPHNNKKSETCYQLSVTEPDQNPQKGSHSGGLSDFQGLSDFIPSHACGNTRLNINKDDGFTYLSENAQKMSKKHDSSKVMFLDPSRQWDSEQKEENDQVYESSFVEERNFLSYFENSYLEPANIPSTNICLSPNRQISPSKNKKLDYVRFFHFYNKKKSSLELSGIDCADSELVVCEPQKSPTKKSRPYVKPVNLSSQKNDIFAIDKQTISELITTSLTCNNTDKNLGVDPNFQKLNTNSSDESSQRLIRELFDKTIENQQKNHEDKIKELNAYIEKLKASKSYYKKLSMEKDLELHHQNSNNTKNDSSKDNQILEFQKNQIKERDEKIINLKSSQTTEIQKMKNIVDQFSLIEKILEDKNQETSRLKKYNLLYEDLLKSLNLKPPLKQLRLKCQGDIANGVGALVYEETGTSCFKGKFYNGFIHDGNAVLRDKGGGVIHKGPILFGRTLKGSDPFELAISLAKGGV